MSQSGLLRAFLVVEEFLKNREGFFQNLIEEKQLRTYFVSSNFAVAIFSAIYGATMGLYAGGIQIAYDAIKIPLLLLISVYVTVPSFYVLSSLLGGKTTFRQMVVLLLSGLTIMSVVLLALVPVNLFFILTTANETFTSYAFLVLLNIVIFTLAGLFSVLYVLRGFKAIFQSSDWIVSFSVGSIIFMFVGTQLAWVLRPYFHYYPEFIRPLEGNFYVSLIELILGVLRRRM
ncbi:MAG: hypothetical protein OEX77_03330 [Candidatus Bathyarchaeota archaeon]|nr:hypothetical protein [Candidatus Bathyarchaeota archaeon]MDH5733392.1 hypothetical protein [Candidatus Bathyarchaeota archaeon]